MKKNEEELFNTVFSQMTMLPAYKFKHKSLEILKQYSYIELNKSIRKKTLKNVSRIDNDYDRSNNSIVEIYQRPNQRQIFSFSFSLLSDSDKRIGLIAIMSLAFAFLTRTSNFWLIAVGASGILIFSLFLLIYSIQFSMFYSDVQNTFSKINRILDDVNDYIFNFADIDETNLEKKVYKILKHIIEDDISSLDYEWKKIHIFNILFAFILSFLCVYISGDILVQGIKLIADHLSFGDFDLIEELNEEKLATFILFPIGIAISKDTVISCLKKRNQRLRQSLVIVENRLEKLNH